MAKITIPLFLAMLLVHAASGNKLKIARLLLNMGLPDAYPAIPKCKETEADEFQKLVNGESLDEQRMLRASSSTLSHLSHRQLPNCAVDCCGMGCNQCWIPECNPGCWESCRRRDLEGDEEDSAPTVTVLHKNQCKVEFEHFKNALKWAKENAETDTCKDYVKKNALMQCYEYDDGIIPHMECVVFQMGPNKIDLTGNGKQTAAFGNVCLTPGAELKQKGEQFIAGDIYIENPKKIKMDENYLEGDIEKTDLAESLKDVNELSDKIKEAGCDRIITKDELKEILEKDGSHVIETSLDQEEPEVICFTDGEDTKIDEDLVIKGDGSHPIYFKIDGKFEFKNQITTSDELDDCQVTWYITAEGKEAKGSQGHLPGTIFNLDGKISLEKSRVTCAVRSKQDIQIGSESTVGRVVTNEATQHGQVVKHVEAVKNTKGTTGSSSTGSSGTGSSNTGGSRD